jgi:hypothetical protein
VQEAILVEEQAHILHPFDRRDLSVELGEIRAPVVRIEVERAAEVGQLSQLVMEISNALVDLGMLPIQNIHHLPKSVQEAQASGPSPWDSAWVGPHARGRGISAPPSFAPSVSCLLERL